MIPFALFDDDKGLLAPLRDLRPIQLARTGALTTQERWAALLNAAPVAQFCEPRLAPLAASLSGLPTNTLPPALASILLINGRCTLPPAADPKSPPNSPRESIPDVASLPLGTALVEQDSGDVIAAHVQPAQAAAIARGERTGLREVPVAGRHLLARPWHVIASRDAAIALDLALLARRLPELTSPPPHVLLAGPHPPRVAPSATLMPGVILNTLGGPITVDERAVVRPGAILTGPCSIGTDVTILEHAHIKPNTAIGPNCKVAGEVGGTIIQAYTNKAHDGHLGDSWLGEWVNLGAGTTVSNLLNTYGEIKSAPEPNLPPEPTGLTFFGCILADHVKTAICTRIMTGSIVHTGTMWADPAPIRGTVPRFTWATAAGHTDFRPDKFEEVARAAMKRRSLAPSPDALARLIELRPPRASR